MSSLGEGPPENVEIMTDKAVDVASQVGPAVNELQRPRMEEIKKILRNTDTSPAEKQARMKEIKKILVGFGFAVSTGLLISVPIFCCSFLAGTLHKGPLVFAALTIPLTAMFPRAVCFYLITNTLFSVAFRSVLQKPSVKEFLAVPIIPPTPPSQSPPAEIYLEEEVEERKKE